MKLGSHESPPQRAGFYAASKLASNTLPFSVCAGRGEKKSIHHARDRIPAFRDWQDDTPTRTQTKTAAVHHDRGQSKISLHRKLVVWAGADSPQRNQDCKAPATPEWLDLRLRGRVRSSALSIRRPGASAKDEANPHPPVCESA